MSPTRCESSVHSSSPSQLSHPSPPPTLTTYHPSHQTANSTPTGTSIWGVGKTKPHSVQIAQRNTVRLQAGDTCEAPRAQAPQAGSSAHPTPAHASLLTSPSSCQSTAVCPLHPLQASPHQSAFSACPTSVHAGLLIPALKEQSTPARPACSVLLVRSARLQ